MASPGRCPPPLAEHRVWPPYPAPKSLGGHRGDILAEKERSGQTSPAPLEPLSIKPLQAHFSVTPCLSFGAEQKLEDQTLIAQ